MQSPLAQAINPAWALQIASDALGFEYTDNMILPGVTLQSGAGQQQGATAPQGVSTPGSRQDNSQNMGKQI
jgi:hypothetical protein